ncbi:hypothetical protein [Streptomyces griseosporeus]|uniref:hypothetical protein n=1 Tax=Streptomyces griseosporeus TaxID=1910 RepID=UPI00167DB08E
MPLEAVRAWRCPARETTDQPLLAGAPARLHEEKAAQALEAAAGDVPADVDVHRRTVEGHAVQVLLAASPTPTCWWPGPGAVRATPASNATALGHRHVGGRGR